MSDIREYLPHYISGGVPEYRDGSVFTTIIPLAVREVTEPGPSQDQVGTKSGKTEERIVDMLKKGSNITRNALLKMLSERGGSKLVERVGSKLVESQLKILVLVKEKPSISKRKLSDIIGISNTAVDKNIAKLKSLGVLKRIGPAKGGYWEVVE
ncbi:MAG: winged helix-turn-helix transcriptional regulator [Candidatus Thermoplasmatota archaeon]|nr:winged helix-turn-helix transcriptional regulator [Candidatus Thermoplasmatota archaeon]